MMVTSTGEEFTTKIKALEVGIGVRLDAGLKSFSTGYMY